MRDGEVKQQLANDHVEWEFIIEKALWYGGFWECMVQTSYCKVKLLDGVILNLKSLTLNLLKSR